MQLDGIRPDLDTGEEFTGDIYWHIMFVMVTYGRHLPYTVVEVIF